MKKTLLKSKKLVLVIFMVFTIIYLFLFILHQFFIINTTASQPYGFYLKTAKYTTKGDLVSVYVSHDFANEAYKRGYLGAGFWPSHYKPIIKEIVAVSGDVVEVKENGVFVNGQLIQNSIPLKNDSNSRPMPNLIGDTYILIENEFFCLSRYNPSSFDGRYLGITYKKDICTTIEPFITW